MGFWAYRSGLGVVWMVSIDSPPSEEPGTTLVPWKTGRMVAGTMESMGTNGWQLGPPPTGTAKLGVAASSITFEGGLL